MNLLAQIAVEKDALLNYGPMGIFLVWLMWRDERMGGIVKGLAHRIDGLTRALLMDLVSRDSTGPATKAQAQREIAKIEERLPKN